jgi:ABC-type sugar transport system ATPase subunit
MSAAAPRLRVRGLTKAWPGVLALKSVDLEVHAGEVLAVVGENGAGKSTLLKVVSGAARADRGSVELDGRALEGTPAQVARRGVATIYQELSLVPALSVRENLFLGRERSRRGFVDVRRERRLAAEVLARLGGRVDPERRVGRLEVARQQLVEIARALLADARLLILDEPTAALTPAEVDRLMAVLDELRSDGLGVVFVSHRLDEVFRLADRIAVLRDGACLGAWPKRELDRRRLIELMVGRSLEKEYPKRRVERGEVVLAVEGLSGGCVREVSFEVRAGEVLGIAGLVGAGRTELARLIFGADRSSAGEVRVDGRPLRARQPGDAIDGGVALLTEDRKGQGLVLGLSARDNFALANLPRWSRRGWLDLDAEAAAFSRHVERLGIRLSGPDQRAGTLSGGNQQKLLVARWLEHDARVLIFDEPTRGIDVGARHDVYELIGELAARGRAIVMISSELPEVLGMSDRILVMHDGRVTGQVDDPAAASQEDLLALAVA